MYKRVLFATLLGGTVLFTLSAHAGGRGGAGVAAPWIDSAQIDAKQSVLTIQGHSFGRTKPSVLLGKLPLRIRESTDREIVAELPDNLRTASYRLVVATGSLARNRSDPFFTTILADVYEARQSMTRQ